MEGIYVYQQIVKTPEEWEGNTTVWPENVWLFEKLGGGLYNMALSDGIHTYSELKKVFSSSTIGVRLDSKPDGTVLTYNNGTPFILGMSAIYPDDSSEDGLGISFFKGIDSEGNAIWGVGGGGMPSEKVTITLDTNQADKTFLIGTDITVSYGKVTNTYTWNGMDDPHDRYKHE